MGHSGSAGELGHITVLPDGPQCGCGNHGCLYMLSSVSAIVRSVRGRLRQVNESVLHNALPGQSLGALSLAMLIDAASQGDEVVLGAVREAGTYLAVAIANVINLMNPSLVVVGGPVAEFGEPFMEAIQQEVRQRALWDALHSVSIVPSALNNTAGTVGAAAIFLDTLNVADMIAAP
jgi:predicted NBD/HSP70 family sugar kinase